MKQKIIDRKEFKNIILDIKGRDIIIGFNEPAFKKSKNNDLIMDSKLNARFVSYFLPAIELARKQNEKPRLIIISGLNMALEFNAKNEEERKIMIADNNIKIDFLRAIFEKFFINYFSLVEYIVSQDILKISELKIKDLWNIINIKEEKDFKKVKFHLAKFLYPKKFNKNSYSELSDKQKNDIELADISKAFKYAVSHTFALGDINFKGNHVHNNNGYVSISGESEEIFNIIRENIFNFIINNNNNFFNKKIFYFNNLKIILKNNYKVPPAYNGMYKKGELSEVTYENNRELEFYDGVEELKDQMDYMYKNIISKSEYRDFWNSYRDRYFELKDRYKKAYNISKKW